MQARQDIFPFLDLPLELRNIIYAFVLRSDARSTPRFPWKSGRRRHEPGKRHEIRYQSKPTAVASYGLLCANRLISNEMQKAIAHERTHGGIVYKLDCMFEELTLFPTWLSLPTSPKHIQHLEINVRLFNCKRYPAECGDTRMVLVGRLVKLLSQLLLHGPQFTHNRRLDGCMPLLESLTFNFDTMPMRDPRNVVLARWLDDLAMDGLLFTMVKTFCLRCGDNLKCRKIKDKGDISMDLSTWAEHGWIFGFKYNWRYEAEACCDGIGWQTS